MNTEKGFCALSIIQNLSKKKKKKSYSTPLMAWNGLEYLVCQEKDGS